MKPVYSNAAIVFGSGGGIGKAIKQELLSGSVYKNVICYSKSNDIQLDITDAVSDAVGSDHCDRCPGEPAHLCRAGMDH